MVLNVEQIDGLTPDFYEPLAPIDDGRTIELCDEAETFFAATGADIRHGGDRACYFPAADRVQMPERRQFRDAESYCATLAHELTHWTGHPSPPCPGPQGPLR